MKKVLVCLDAFIKQHLGMVSSQLYRCKKPFQHQFVWLRPRKRRHSRARQRHVALGYTRRVVGTMHLRLCAYDRAWVTAATFCLLYLFQKKVKNNAKCVKGGDNGPIDTLGLRATSLGNGCRALAGVRGSMTPALAGTQGRHRLRLGTGGALSSSHSFSPSITLTSAGNSALRMSASSFSRSSSI